MYGEKKYHTECKFIGLKNNRLNAKECKEISTEPISERISIL